jgi:hypothetical protein
MLQKYIKKLIIIVITVVLLAEMVPAMAIGYPSVQLPEMADVAVDIAPSTVDVEIPPTFTIDESCNATESENIPPEYTVQ